jgi:hypothetical protein
MSESFISADVGSPLPNHQRHYFILIMLVLLQITYVTFDLVEAVEENTDFGIIAGFFMIIFGVAIVIVGLYSWYKTSHFDRDIGFELVEGCIYLGLGTGITIVRWNNSVDVKIVDTNDDKIINS